VLLCEECSKALEKSYSYKMYFIVNAEKEQQVYYKSNIFTRG